MEIKENEYTSTVQESQNIKEYWPGITNIDEWEGFLDGLELVRSLDKANAPAVSLEASDYKRGLWKGIERAWQIKRNPESWPDFDQQKITGTICSKCGMEWKTAMLYSCPNNDCPIQPKATL